MVITQRFRDAEVITCRGCVPILIPATPNFYSSLQNRRELPISSKELKRM